MGLGRLGRARSTGGVRQQALGGGVVGVPLGGRRTGNTGGAMESGRALPCYWMVGGGMKCE